MLLTTNNRRNNYCKKLKTMNLTIFQPHKLSRNLKNKLNFSRRDIITPKLKLKINLET